MKHSDPLRDAARALMEAVENDENQHGGTLNRETLRLASLLRIELNRKPAAPKRGLEMMCEIRDSLRLHADAFEAIVVTGDDSRAEFARAFYQESAKCWRAQADALDVAMSRTLG